MALSAEGSYEDVLSLLTDGLAWISGEKPLTLPSKSVLRSKSPDLVLREIWGLLWCHYAIRTLMGSR